MDDIAALMATTTQCYVTSGGASTKGVQSGLIGPQTMHYDTWRSLGWDVITHGCFLTYPHHDAGGQMTYSYIRTGAKLWGYLDLATTKDEDQKAIIKGWSDYYSSAMATETYAQGVKLGTILLERGGGFCKYMG